MADNEDTWPEWMHVRFFGEPWPSRELRAPICEDDRWEMPTPVGEDCWLCNEPIIDGESGTGIWLSDGEKSRRLYSHRECGLRNVLGCSASLEGKAHDHTGNYREDARRVDRILTGRRTAS